MRAVHILASVVVAAGLASAASSWGQKQWQSGVVAAEIVKVVAESSTHEAGSNAPRPNDVSAFMRLKLNHSQKVLEGIATEDFDLIAKNSQQMGLLAQDENWKVYQTPEYRTHSAEFQRIAAALTKAGQDKNVDSAALAYIQLTMTCVNCHKHTRTIRLASAR